MALEPQNRQNLEFCPFAQSGKIFARFLRNSQHLSASAGSLYVFFKFKDDVEYLKTIKHVIQIIETDRLRGLFSCANAIANDLDRPF